MDNTIDIKELRPQNKDIAVSFKKLFFGGYDPNEVDKFLSQQNQNIAQMQTSFKEKVDEIQLSVSMAIRERDNFAEETRLLTSKIKEMENIIEDKKLENMRLYSDIDSLKLDKENLINDNLAAIEFEQSKTSDRKIQELEIENSMLTEEHKTLTLELESLGEEINSLNEQLSHEKTSNKSHLLAVEGRMYEKDTKNKIVSEKAHKYADDLLKCLRDLDLSE